MIENYLLYFNQKYKGNWDDVYNAIKNLEQVDKEIINKIANEPWNKDEGYISILSDDYPMSLSIISKPPFILYWKGNKDILNSERKIHITGNYKSENIDKVLSLIHSVPDNCAIVNGGWKGLDEDIIRTAIKFNKKLILISPCGIGLNYFEKLIPTEYTNYLIISELPNACHATKASIYLRNRLLVGLSNSMVLLATQDKKLYGIIDEFLNFGKDIYCVVPSPNDKENANIDLINLGAEAIQDLSLPLQH